jgi:transposase
MTTKLLVTDDLWAAIAPLLPPEPEKPKGGRPRCDDRAALGGILYVLRTGIGWERLPYEAFGCSGMTCWRRLRDWQQAGVWDDLHRVLLERLAAADGIDWSRAAIDSASYRAKGGPSRRRRGSVRTRRIAVARAPSAMWSSTGAARRSAWR